MDSSNFAGNEGLYILDANHSSLPRPNQYSKDKIVSIVSGIVGFFSLICAMGVCWAIKNRKPVRMSLEEHAKPDVFHNYYFPKAGFKYQDLVEATDDFSDNVVIGKGACGVVYKAVMADGEVVAVKKLQSGDKLLQPHVGDFGLAKLMDSPCSKTMSAVAGSYGYISPVRYLQFGVVLLELVTGRPPVQPLDQGGDLVTCVRRSVHGMIPVFDIFDKRLDLSCKKTIDEMSLFLRIALFCTSPSPLNRPTMREVIAMMIDSREVKANSPLSQSSETLLDDAISCRDYLNPAETETSPWHSRSSSSPSNLPE
ncbi:hypothetical protein L1987_70731 [Smallanthus sonchifolius]|uniref:Uncharacterized protein n=1 Tax=Smallanthus sonchifolius TaxID=185202 RepID=A0ACB9AQP0_9ASTR|nr:hypothetical protein L1987_70731 [Smallanthus sonchifolius]